MTDHSEVDRIRRALLALEAQRPALGDEVVDTALTPLRDRLDELRAGGRHEERKLVTILFADLVGSTALSAQLDAEDMRELLNTYFGRCRTSVERHGGVVEKFIGDAVMAVFGLPLSREDDPERAVLAALEIARLPEHLEAVAARDLPQPLATRVAVNTGEVVVGLLGERLKDELVVVGDAVNIASRVQSAAPPGRVLITHDTYRHLRGAFDVQAVDPLQLKGVAHPVPAYLVEGARQPAHRRPRRGVEGVETRMVGREAELARLRDAFEAAVRGGERQVLTLVGDAGMGKSRLVEELERWLERRPEKVSYLKGRAHPSGQSSPYSLVRDLFAFRFGIQDSDPPPEVQAKLEDGYARAFDPPPSAAAGETQRRERVRAAHVLGRLLGFGLGTGDELGGADGDARGLHDEALVHLRDYLAALGRRAPVVVVLEDLHWADESSLELVQRLLDSLAPLRLLVVATTRPSLFERRPGRPGALGQAGRLDLGPLSRPDSFALVEEILGRVDDLPTELAVLVVGTAEGNPYYIEELLKMLVDDGIIRSGGGRWEVDRGRLSTIRVPPTLTGVLQARVDSVPADERAYLQRGSVIGRVFWDRAIEYLDAAPDVGGRPGPEPDVPDRLRARQLISERERSTFEDTREFLFKHALLRDVTYDTLLRRQRRVLHGQAARWLEQVTERSGRAGEFAALIAGHYEQAGEAAPAVAWLLEAGRGAASRYANAEALHALGRALELAPADDDERQFEIRATREAVYGLQGLNDERSRDLHALHELADALGDPARQATASLRAAAYALAVSDFQAAIAAAGRAGQLARTTGDTAKAVESDLLQADALARQGDLAAARDFVERSLRVAAENGLTRVEANSLRQLGMIAYFMGDHQEARDRFSDALELFVSLGDKQGEGVALNNLGGVTSELGDHRGATACYRRSLELCRQIGDRVGEARALNNLGITAMVHADYAAAEDHYLRSLQICREVGQRSFEMSALDNLGNLALHRYQFSRARAYQLESLAGAREIGDRFTEGYTLANLARGCLMIGDWDGALAYISDGLELVRRIGDHQGECDLVIRLSQYHCGTGQAEAALSRAREALDLARRHHFPSEEGSALHAMGDAAMSRGDARAACEHYQGALAVRRRLGQAAEAHASQAGLAGARLSLGLVDQAASDVTELLDAWEARGALGLDQPVVSLLTCHRALAAARNPRAAGALAEANRLLQQCAAGIDDPGLRHRFLEEIPAHRELADTWKHLGTGELPRPAGS